MSVKLIPKVTCDVCARSELDPPDTWKTFDIALPEFSYRPTVNLCDLCASVQLDVLIAALEAKYGRGAPCLR